MSYAPYPGTRAVRRAVSVLKAFTVFRPELGLSEVARVTGLNKATVFRLLSALEKEELVERVPQGEAYRLGPEFAALGLRTLGATELLLAAQAEVPELADATQETAGLHVLVGREVVIVDDAFGRLVLAAANREVGTRWPAHATSTGKALLAFGTEEQTRELLRRPLSRLTPKTICDPEAFRRELRRVHANGYATNQEETEIGYAAAGVPVIGANGRAVAALTVWGPSARLTTERMSDITRRLSTAASRISGRLGVGKNRDA